MGRGRGKHCLCERKREKDETKEASVEEGWWEGERRLGKQTVEWRSGTAVSQLFPQPSRSMRQQMVKISHHKITPRPLLRQREVLAKVLETTMVTTTGNDGDVQLLKVEEEERQAVCWFSLGTEK